MARSIHDTWGVKERAERADWSDPEIPRAIAEEMKKNWLRQGYLREGERNARRRGALQPQPVHPDLVPILVEDQAPYVFHAAGEEDIRAILRCLPPGSLDGLQAIKLCVDQADARREPRVRDPFTGRLRLEIIPGVFMSSVYGTYAPSTAIIRLFAFLCDPAALGPLALYFKMQALRTLVHEAAHHFDDTFRKRRSRWDVDDKSEQWAERIESEQSTQIVASYVGERYSLECMELRSWIKDHGGTALSPLVFLGHHHAFVDLASSVLTGRERDETQVAFARALHHSGEHEGARQAVKRVLAKRPDHAAALGVSACITLCHDKDFKASESLCRRAIASDPTCMDAWEVLARGRVRQEDWEGASLACDRGLAHVPAGGKERFCLIEIRVRSRLHLEDWSGADSAMERMRAWDTERGPRHANVYLAIAHCWSGRLEEALVLTQRLLSTGKYEPWTRWLAAVQFDSAHRLGRPHQAGAFSEADLAAMETRCFTSVWARRIRDHVEMAAR